MVCLFFNTNKIFKTLFMYAWGSRPEFIRKGYKIPDNESPKIPDRNRPDNESPNYGSRYPEFR